MKDGVLPRNPVGQLVAATSVGLVDGAVIVRSAAGPDMAYRRLFSFDEMSGELLWEYDPKVAEEIKWQQKVESKDPNKVYGKGFTLFWKAPAMPPNASSTAFIKFEQT